MTQKESSSNPALYSWRGKLPLLQLLPLALQHVLAMVVGCVTPAIVVSGVAGLSQADSVLLIQSSLLMAAIATVIQIFPAFRWFGSGLPVIIGVSFSYLPALTAIAGQYPLSTVFGAQIIGGIAAILVGAFMKPLRQFFPPLVSVSSCSPSACPSIRRRSTTWREVPEPKTMGPGKTGWSPFLP
jgi:NCS2 family nucleobase:cation symporter-2